MPDQCGKGCPAAVISAGERIGAVDAEVCPVTPAERPAAAADARMTGQGDLSSASTARADVGKSTTAALTARQLTDQGIPVHQTTQPSPTPLGQLIRSSTDTYTGMALACLVAGDRHHQLAAEIRPQPDPRSHCSSATATCPPASCCSAWTAWSWDIIGSSTRRVTRPDLAVILNASPPVLAARLASAVAGIAASNASPDPQWPNQPCITTPPPGSPARAGRSALSTSPRAALTIPRG